MDQFSGEKLIMTLADWPGASGGNDWKANGMEVFRRLVYLKGRPAPSERR